MTELILQAKQLTKSYPQGAGELNILKGVSLDLHSGEAISIVGASGSGKSTLLHILGTLDRPNSGELVIHGQDVLSLSDDELSRYRNEQMGFVFQFHHLLAEFNALENVMMPALIARLPQPVAREQAEAILVRVGLKERLTHRVSTLSGGEQQRVAVARALVLEPEVLLADEPTGNLDPKSGSRVQELILELNRERGLTSVIVTHNLEMARILDRQITLLDGKAVILQGE